VDHVNYITPLFPFVAGWILLLFTDSLTTIGLVNGLLQITLFAFVVNLPTWRTGRMSYVDIGWPLGLAVIGIVTLLLSQGYWLRVAVVGGVYLFVGLRMGLGALIMWRQGRLKVEFPRYEYQKLRWQQAGKTNVRLAMQVDATVQGLANTSYLAFPALIIGANPNPSISVFEIVGLLIWVGAFAMESVADAQKLAFLSRMKREGKRDEVCNVGLWRYSRHPNYFAEWMVWNALVIASVPSWLELRSTEHVLVWLLLAAGLLFVSRVMYATLVYYTGAVPSEHFSLRKRPAYEAYQRQTNMFFPGPVAR
jgi:steroid 5-alpha reductase family enzyme